MQVSFIIPLYNCLAHTRECLRTLSASLPVRLDHEIIFVDDGSTDGTRDWLAKLPAPCRVVLNATNLGFAGACNRGAAIATGDLIFFLNNDLLLLPHWLEPMLTAFGHFPAVGLVGNVQLNVTTGAVDHAGIYFNHQGKPAHRTDLPATTRWLGWPAYRAVDALTGACFALRRTVWQQLGGFDEDFLNGSEDIDLALRATTAGLTHHIALRSIVRHHISASVGRNVHNEQNTSRLVQRWQNQIATLSARAWSRHQIAIHADQSGVFDYHLIFSALAYLILLPVPPPAVRVGVAQAIAHERRRWRELLQGAAPSPPPPPVHTEQI